MAICSEEVHWTVCAAQVKAAISNASTMEEAVAAANSWAQRYKLLYKAYPSNEWAPSDVDRFEDELGDLLEDTVGQWLDPVDLVLKMALVRYLPQIAAVLEFPGAAISSALYILLAPSPVANEFQAAKPYNEEIGDLLRAKLEPNLGPTWQWSYDAVIRDAFQRTHGGNDLP